MIVVVPLVPLLLVISRLPEPTLSTQPDAQDLMPALGSAQLQRVSHGDKSSSPPGVLLLQKACLCLKIQPKWLLQPSNTEEVEGQRNATPLAPQSPSHRRNGILQVKQYFQETFQASQLWNMLPSPLCPGTLPLGRALQHLTGLTLCLPAPLLPKATGFSSALPAG